jgi:acetyl esterase/lipase
MNTHCPMLAILLGLSLATGALAADTALTPEETRQIETARAAALKTPEVRAATAKFNAARKAYQADRAKFPADRKHEVAVAYRKAAKELEDAKRKTILAQNPALAPLLEKVEAQTKAGKRAMNEGETVADSDVGKNPAMRPIKDAPGLPRVLLIGDSISIGYTLAVRALLKGKANVHRIPVNGGATEVGLAKMKDWLGDGKWDVIHFNFGLHDAKYASETTQRASREQYAENLRTLVAQMKTTGAKLIFATTTPVPKGGVLSPGRKFDSIPARNEVAVKVMRDNGVVIDDLYTVALPVMERMGRPNDVHFAPEGYELLARAVAASIEAELESRRTDTPVCPPPPASAQKAQTGVSAPRDRSKALDPINEMAAKLEPTRVVVYKKVGERELRLNIFEPADHKASDRRPCFLTIHGGGWTGLSPRRQYPFAAHFAKCGMVAISVEYRLVQKGSGSTVFDCVKDARSAVRYVRAHAVPLGIDPQKIIVNGGSAGGHLAAGTALFDGVDENGEDTSVSCMPNALVLYFPVIDTSKEGYGNAKIGERWQEISPLHRVKAGVPPTIIFHGTGDTVTPFKGAKAFHEAMLKAGNRCELDVNEGGKHGYLMFDRALYQDTLRKTEAFLARLKLVDKASR